MNEDDNKQVTWSSILRSVIGCAVYTYRDTLLSYPVAGSLGTALSLYFTARTINRSDKKYYILGGFGSLTAFGIFYIYRRYHKQVMQQKEYWSMFHSICNNPNRATSIVNKQTNYGNTGNPNYNINSFNGMLRNITISANSTFNALHTPMEEIFKTNALTITMKSLMSKNRDTVCVLNTLRTTVLGKTLTMLFLSSFLRLFLKLSYGIINRHLVSDLAYKSKAGNSAVDACVKTLEDATRDILNVSYNIQTDVVLPILVQIVMQQLLQNNSPLLQEQSNTWMTSKIDKDDCKVLLLSISDKVLHALSSVVDPAAITDARYTLDVSELDVLQRVKAVKQRNIEEMRLDVLFMALKNQLFLEPHVFGGSIADHNGYTKAEGLQKSPFGFKSEVVTLKTVESIANGADYSTLVSSNTAENTKYSDVTVKTIQSNAGDATKESSTSFLAHMLLPLPLLLQLLQAHAETLPNELVLRPHDYPGVQETVLLKHVYLWRAHAVLGELFVLLKSPILLECVQRSMEIGIRHIVDLQPSLDAGFIRVVTGMMKLDTVLWPNTEAREEVALPNSLLGVLDKEEKHLLAVTKAVYMPIGLNENVLGGEAGVTASSEGALMRELEMILSVPDAPQDLNTLLRRQAEQGDMPGTEEDFMKLFLPKKKAPKSKKKLAIKKSD